MATDDVDDEIAKSLLRALAVDDAKVLQTKFDLVVACGEADTVTSMRPDFHALERIQTRGVMVTAQSDRKGVDFRARFFAPKYGINEDPVAGSAHCCLATYWSNRLGRKTLVGYQASRRGGIVRCGIHGDRVKLSGTAVTVMEGHLTTAMRQLMLTP